MIRDRVDDLDVSGSGYKLSLGSGERVEIQACVIASGNNLPRNPSIPNPLFFRDPNYFQDPWNIKAVSDLPNTHPVLIIGNGLTMVDTVLGLLENGCEQPIYSISPNGFNILPHQHSGISYPHFASELPGATSLYDIVKLFNRHMKRIREFGLSPEPIIDSLRPYTQKIWKQFTTREKQIFMSRLRHLWGVARHRIPLHIHDRIQQLRIAGKLFICAGKITEMRSSPGGIQVEYYNKRTHSNDKLTVSRVINCTGPETDLKLLEKFFLKNCLEKGLVTQDELNLGINADLDTYEVINARGRRQGNLFTLGSNLKGLLWETTAVNELREQAKEVAFQILKKL
jgi:uncharacterized NAD(P)/FAD-binding protein YdhS